MSAVSKKLIPRSSARLMNGRDGVFVEHPRPPGGIAIGHGAETQPGDFQTSGPEADILHP